MSAGAVLVGPVDPTLLVELHAALAAGASPGAALVAVAGDGPLAGVARAVRLGTPLEQAAADAPDDLALGLLVRALAVAERAGAGGLVAVSQAQQALRDADALRRLLHTRTLQARGTALVLTVVPVAAWAVLVLLQPAAVAFYATPIGLGSLVAAASLVAGARWWMRRIIANAGRAVVASDPLHPAPPAAARRPLLAVSAFTLLAALVLGPAAALVVAAVGSVLARRGCRAGALASLGRTGGACEAVELVAVALAAGLPPAQALAAVAPLAPPAASPLLAAAARRLAAGEGCAEALAGSGLAPLGEVLAACARWGAPAGPALQSLAAELRADRAAAVEAAAERTQLALVFPTTLLTLPAFVLGVVPPLLWTAFTGAGG